MAAADAAPQLGAGWDEAQCTTALAQLERMKEQLDDLRLTIPRVVEPFYSPPTPAMYRAFKEGITTSQNEIKNFRNQWQSPEIQSVYEHARGSLNANSDLSASAQVQRYGWIEKEAKGKRAATRRKDGAQKSEKKQEALTQEDISRIVEDFRKTYPKIPLIAKNENRDLTTQFVSDSVRLRFHVIIEQEANGEPRKLNTECQGPIDSSLPITRFIASRPNPNNLKYLLDMIAAYRTVKDITCAKCKKLYDEETVKPFARRSRQIPGANEETETVWEAFHESCLD